jgi:hypothetical protein
MTAATLPGRTLLEQARTLIAAGASRMTVNVPADWKAPPRFPAYQVLSVSPADGSRNLALYAHRLIDYLATIGIS